MRPSVLLLIAALFLVSCGSLERQRAAREANPAPCPNVFVLDNAARFIEFADGEEPSLDAVRFSGEFDDVVTACRYFADTPIDARVDLAFSIGRGPAAEEATTTVRYFVAVTRTNRDVIAKQEFEVPVTFRRGQTTVSLTDSIERIVIPRAREGISGVNFEIAVGFVLTEEQYRWNRSGRSLKFPEA